MKGGKKKKDKKKKDKNNNGLSNKIKKSCHDECNKGKKLMSVIMNKQGKKMGLSKEEIKKRIQEYDDHCESNCIQLLKDKDILKEILKKVKDKKRGFELLSQVKKQKQLNNPLKKIQNLSQIWFGNEIDNVRQKHIEGKSTEIEVCKNCSFKDVYDWVK